jgi:hypothetical protein
MAGMLSDSGQVCGVAVCLLIKVWAEVTTVAPSVSVLLGLLSNTALSVAVYRHG